MTKETKTEPKAEGQITVAPLRKKSASKLKVNKVPAPRAKAKDKDFWDELFG